MEALPIYKFHEGQTPDTENLNRLAVNVLRLIEAVDALQEAQTPTKKPASGEKTAAK